MQEPNPSSETARVLYMHGRDLERAGRPSEAAHAYEQAICLAPDMVEAHTMLAQLMVASKNFAAARLSLERALKINPSLAAALVLMAMVLKEEAKFAEGESYLRRAIDAAPNDGFAHALLGSLLQQGGKFEEATACFARAIELEPGQAGSYFGLVQGKTITEADRQLIAQMESLRTKRSPNLEDSALIRYALGKAFQDLGDYESAIGYFEEANQVSERLLVQRGQCFDPGQYRAAIDSLIKTFSKAFFARHAESGSSSELPVFIVGMIRSGTTLVEQILSSHPEVGAGGELPFLLEKGIEAQQELIAGRFEGAKLERLALDYRVLLRSLAPGKKKVTDKMPTNYMVLGLIHLLFPHTRIISCRRNPVDNCLSIFTTPYIRGSPDYAHNKANIVFAYKQYERLMEHWKSTLPADCFIEVQYEELVQNEEGTARKLISSLGLEWNDACLRPEQNWRMVFTPSMWQVRQPIYKSGVNRWRNYEPWLGEFRSLI